jgi:hypothetical protein
MNRFGPALALAAGLLGITTPAIAQFSFDFSTGTLSGPPAWQGDTAHFTINANGELQLQAPAAGTSILYVATPTMPDSARWLVRLRLDFAPSASNRLRIYLQATTPDLTGARGYFVEIGENGSSDALRLYRQDSAAAPVLLLTGLPGFVAAEPVELDLRIERSAAGVWQLVAGTPGQAPVAQGMCVDTTYGGSAGVHFVALHCLYSATRKDKFYFDNISLSDLSRDTIPPVLLNASALSFTEIELRFDEALDSATAVQPGHYAVSSIGPPAGAAWQRLAPERVRLLLPSALQPAAAYTVDATGVADTAGNTGAGETAEFICQLVAALAAHSIVIDEIMSDPSPSVGLPEVEWLELRNVSAAPVDLQMLRLAAGADTTAPLPPYVLSPGAVVALCSSTGAAALAPFTTAGLAIADFPGLNNAGEDLALLRTDSTGLAIDRVAYRPEWHSDPARAGGGWSLERRAPYDPCLGRAAWQSCPVWPGGTPGASNAAPPLAPDLAPPRLLAVWPRGVDTLELRFSENIALAGADPADALVFDPAVPVAATWLDTDGTLLFVRLAAALTTGALYRIQAAPAVHDCAGNPAAVDSLVFGLPAAPAPRDLVINEILFNPAPGGARYVELYNRSGKLLASDGLFLADAAGSPGARALPPGILLPPATYAVVTPDTADVAARFAAVDRRLLFEQMLPAMADQGGDLVLYAVAGPAVAVLDSLRYADDYHHAFLTASEREGIALERLSADGPSAAASNWASAAGNGSPTRPNSQRLLAAPAPADSLVWLPVARLSPDGDGREDFVEIQYRLPAPGFVASARIYDAGGNPIRRLAQAEPLPIQGWWRWDGARDDGRPVEPGLYIAYFEFVHPAGTVRRLKKVMAVLPKF